jgi:hypothetical protein
MIFDCVTLQGFLILMSVIFHGVFISSTPFLPDASTNID